MSRVEDAVRLLADEEDIDGRDLMKAVTKVGGGWMLLRVDAAGARVFYGLCSPGDRNPDIPWALPSGLQEYDLGSVCSILRELWTPLARRWLTEHRSKPFAREELVG
jgi:hypothetical protein